ncbi:MAG TPA: aminotransferase class I and II [bacterium]|nr:aminotransferase class I and II [bacterium]HQG47172.1 aminotransferase class I and II [bacterium]HQI48371.1 aminotransferase class I and II [bacterium]HQJ63756.1 aminotransferase class I and II [bacterium]
MTIRSVEATRYVTPLKEGGSLPAIVEADDDGLYVLKFRGAGQGPKALIAELVGGEIARAAGLPVPEIVFIHLEAELARTEPDPEIHDLIRMSAGLNLGLDYLPGSIMFNPVLHPVSEILASEIVWLDAFVTNIDRTPRNTNMLMWHKQLYLIDHGASLYFHHAWHHYLERSGDPFPLIKDHVLLPSAGALRQAGDKMRAAIGPEVVERVIAMIPEAWFDGNTPFSSSGETRKAYIVYLRKRLEESESFVEEAMRARSLLV